MALDRYWIYFLLYFLDFYYFYLYIYLFGFYDLLLFISVIFIPTCGRLNKLDSSLVNV